ncbi:hypothetical protein Hydth_0549 [Hydrogenobacter thermophilus TK-6]|uniref:Uncharacterized protein n=1 Tax=Hydrogenobacter thermophilus (strain DSM 6534 / IAM 12695 / TK-6) TaxID=608538 RepID=D3DGR1_HYDTT|nr:DUF6682 family protein [Hydrogenobacter thermophilus]ADO44949.1 hypothetical protein Hydth_0549 [Hydrogenobacter thermophilus TK-6]BAI69013.1 hypothetical protein HTH_0551 [Hydrogenobacter thermophilus TK-6]
MTVAEAVLRLRTLLNDPQAIEFTDAELINYINQAQDYIVLSAVNLGFQGFLKNVNLTLTNDQALLPSDFIREYSVSANNYILNSVPPDAEVTDKTYKIIGNTLYSKNASVSLYYFYSLPNYSNLSDTIQIPQIFNNLLFEICVYLAKNRIEVPNAFDVQLSSLYEQKIAQLVSAYGMSFIERPMPF